VYIQQYTRYTQQYIQLGNTGPYVFRGVIAASACTEAVRSFYCFELQSSRGQSSTLARAKHMYVLRGDSSRRRVHLVSTACGHFFLHADSTPLLARWCGHCGCVGQVCLGGERVACRVQQPAALTSMSAFLCRPWHLHSWCSSATHLQGDTHGCLISGLCFAALIPAVRRCCSPTQPSTSLACDARQASWVRAAGWISSILGRGISNGLPLDASVFLAAAAAWSSLRVWTVLDAGSAWCLLS
jgi:hypothetical protein